MEEITVTELKKMKDNGSDFQLIDVREKYEYDICNISGELIPMGQITEAIEKISRDKSVVIHCRSGSRSKAVVEHLIRMHGFTNLYNLKGGILAYADEIDRTLTKY